MMGGNRGYSLFKLFSVILQEYTIIQVTRSNYTSFTFICSRHYIHFKITYIYQLVHRALKYYTYWQIHLSFDYMTPGQWAINTTSKTFISFISSRDLHFIASIVNSFLFMMVLFDSILFYTSALITRCTRYIFSKQA